MAILPIIEVPDPRLRQISKPVESFDAALQTLIDDMFETMYDAPGIGLAAIQVGVPLRLLVIDLQESEEDSDEPGPKNPRVFINPEFSDPSEELNVYTEGCLSIPDQYADVERPKTIRAKWLDREGKAHDELLDGMIATCLQHEVDHLNGIVFIDHLSRMKRDMLLKKLEKQRKQKRAA
ncbi:MAG TPA: peptide deformylase [Sphingomonas sp.]